MLDLLISHNCYSFHVIYLFFSQVVHGICVLVCESKRLSLQVAIITPFNFPLEIPVLQLMGALYMGNKPILKVDSKVCWLLNSISGAKLWFIIADMQFPIWISYFHYTY